ncbi:MAG: IPT/TIG domain-containing protein [Archangium sp.]|nr:IPT/TIG domain-containing protein [Archangium sp.]
MHSTPFRLTFLAALTLSGLAFAQPANDACAGAEVMNGSGPFPLVSSTVSLSGAASAAETPMCATTLSTVWYRFTPTVTDFYTVQSCTPAGNTIADTVLSVYSGDCTTPVTLTNGCNDEFCASKSSVTVQLTAGTTYYVQIGKWLSAALATDTMAIQIERVPLVPNDRCNGSVALSLDTTQVGAINAQAANDAQTGGANACFPGIGQGTATTNAAPGRDAVFSFTPTSSGNYSVRATPSFSTDLVFYMTDSCTAAMVPPQTYTPPQCITGSNRAGSGTTAEQLVCVPLNAGSTYYLWADEGTNTLTASIPLEVEVSACFPETEPNGTPATANALACPTTGFIGTSSEVDFFALGTAGATSRAFALVEARAAGATGSATTDFDVRITNNTDTLEYDDANADVLFGGASGAVAGTPLTSGQPAYVRVTHLSGTVSGPYSVYATVQNGAASAEAEPNDTIGTATAATNNYFSGDVTSTTDVDLFQFEARAGDVLFLALDSNPARAASSTANHTLAILDAAGLPLLAVNDGSTASTVTASPGTLTASTPTVPSETLVWRARYTGRHYARVGRTSTTGVSTYVLSVSFNCLTSIGAPTISTIAPNTGSVVGNTSVTIDGTNFGAASQVFFGNTPVQVTGRTATQLTINTPPGVTGAVNVVVVNPGNQTATATGGFTYFEPIVPPTVTLVTPAVGPLAGGSNVTIDGTLFKTGAEVYFTVGGNRVAATNVVLVNAVRLTATTPAHPAGFAIVTVRNPVDALEGSLNNGFEYLAAPSVTSVTAPTGLTSGGYTVTVAGTGFRAGATVRFGTTLGTGVVVDPSGNSLTVSVPAAAVSGAVNVTVTNPDGQLATLTNGFTYTYPAPTIANVTPPSGFATGGTAITINGNNFLTGATVTVGGVPATSVVRVSAIRLTATTPAGMAGPADIVVTNPDLQAATLSAAFTYVSAPTVTAISPNHGPVQGGTVVTLTGTGFLPNASISIAGVPAFAVTVTSATSATAITNGAPAGLGDVVFTNADTQRGTLPMAFTFDGAPTLVSVSPVSGSSAGGTRVTLTGTGFLPGATVLFGTDASPMVTVMSSTSVQAEAPAHAVGVVSISLRNTDNQLAELPRAFRYVAPPTLTAIGPNTGDVSGGTLITLTGTGFTPGSTVTLDGLPATQVAFVSATELTAFTPPHAPAMVDVVVSSDGVPATLVYGFTYTRGVPTLASVAPVSGPTTGGTLLTLTGSGFAPGATVTVGGAMATNVVIVSPVLARAVVPAHAAGAVDVVLTNDDMQAATLSAGFTFVTPPSGNMGVADGGGGLGTEPVGGGGGAGGVSCGCTAFDGSMLSLGGMGLLLVLSRRRRRS